MGSGRVKKDANQDIHRDEDTSFAKECLQKFHLQLTSSLDEQEN
jgi:hypothetical protein